MTIRRWIVTFGIVLALTGIRGAACGVIYSFVDYPRTNDVIPSSAFVVEGWAVECAPGINPPEFTVDLWNFNTGQWWHPNRITVIPEIRHDVALYVRSLGCPGARDAVGYLARVYPQPPPGRYRLYASWANYYGAPGGITYRDIDIAYD